MYAVVAVTALFVYNMTGVQCLECNSLNPQSGFGEWRISTARRLERFTLLKAEELASHSSRCLHKFPNIPLFIVYKYMGQALYLIKSSVERGKPFSAV